MKVGEYNFERDKWYEYENNKLYKKTASGKKEADIKCVRNVKNYKIFAYRIESTVPFTQYILVDTQSKEVYSYGQHHYLGGALKEIIRELSK